jgi:hypothetical protein
MYLVQVRVVEPIQNAHLNRLVSTKFVKTLAPLKILVILPLNVRFAIINLIVLVHLD